MITILPAMEKIYQGICSICQNAHFCTYPKDSNGGILRCEDFASGALASRALASRAFVEKNTQPKKSKNGVKRPGKHLGLCVNCDNNDFCTYPKPDGGIWRCADYK